MKINVGFFGLLTLLLVGLKLGHVIHCGWFLVLLPLWAPTIGVIAVLLVVSVIAALIALVIE